MGRKRAKSPKRPRKKVGKTPLVETVPSDLLFHVLASVSDAPSLLAAASTCKALQAVEAQSRDALWRRLTLEVWLTSDSYGLVSQMSWKARYKFYVARLHDLAKKPVDQSEVLTVAQLNERYEFFVELGSFPWHPRCLPWHATPNGEEPNVLVQMVMSDDSCLVIPEGREAPEVLRMPDDETKSTPAIDITVRRVADGAVAKLMEGHHSDLDADDQDDDELRWAFQGESQWERAADYDDLDRKSRSQLLKERRGRDSDYEDCLTCDLILTPCASTIADGESDTYTVKLASLMITNYTNYPDCVLDGETMSKLLTSTHLVAWELFE